MVATIIKRVFGLAGAWNRHVALGADGVVVTLLLRAPKGRAWSGCDGRGPSIKEHRTDRWRHLDLGASRCDIESARTAVLPSRRRCLRGTALAGSLYARDFEDVVTLLAQQMARTPLSKPARLCRRSVGKILARVVADKPDRDRLGGLVMIVVQDVGYDADRRFLACGADGSTGMGRPRTASPKTLPCVFGRARRRPEGLDPRRFRST